ncbi:ATP-dependent metallopeptidase FtsH/Yme1/Tma family protein [Nonomuraea dietziae]|uniref:ATP-dependent metallopeptidase FtsH/Yme1/Tma family protein n=1 Tax=Nonomuraea dietziae TaxID=65515 RepID=UPI0031DA0BB2
MAERSSVPKKEPDKDRPKPWRAEGLPGGGAGGRPKINWWRFVITLLVVYAGFFLISSFFDEGQVETISYSQFTKQVTANNVKEVYAQGYSVQGDLKKAATDPRQRQQDLHQVRHRDPGLRQRRPALPAADRRGCGDQGRADQHGQPRFPAQPAAVAAADRRPRGTVDLGHAPRREHDGRRGARRPRQDRRRPSRSRATRSGSPSRTSRASTRWRTSSSRSSTT